MAAEITALDFLLGPIALLINLMKHGYPPESAIGLGELITSGLGTAAWASILTAIGSIFQ